MDPIIPGDVSQIPTFDQALRFLWTSAGISMVVGALISFAQEYIPGWEQAGRKRKLLVTFVICMAAPLIAFIGLAIIGVEPPTWDSLWRAVYLGAYVFFGNQAARFAHKASEPPPAED